MRPGGLSNASPGEVGNLVLRGEDQLFGRQELDAAFLLRPHTLGVGGRLHASWCNTMPGTILTAVLALTKIRNPIVVNPRPKLALQEGRPWTFYLQADGETQKRLAQGGCCST